MIQDRVALSIEQVLLQAEAMLADQAEQVLLIVRQPIVHHHQEYIKEAPLVCRVRAVVLSTEVVHPLVHHRPEAQEYILLLRVATIVKPIHPTAQPRLPHVALARQDLLLLTVAHQEAHHLLFLLEALAPEALVEAAAVAAEVLEVDVDNLFISKRIQQYI